ncbi:hypothetical protein TNCV_1498841, partial [Trichonephila clavipes]
AIDEALRIIKTMTSPDEIWILCDSRSAIQHLSDWTNVGDKTSPAARQEELVNNNNNRVESSTGLEHHRAGACGLDILWTSKSCRKQPSPKERMYSSVSQTVGAAVAEWYRHRIVAGFVTSSSPVPLKTRRVGQRCTLNLSRAEMSSRWCGS